MSGKKQLETVEFDYPLCRQQVEEFQAWLAASDELSERDDVLPFFKDRQQMALLFGMFNQQIGWSDRFATEFDIFGDFACDLVVGEWGTCAYCFVEFEDAKSDSVFERQGTKATREWGRRFDHGYSQIIDWAHKLDGRAPSNDLLARFERYEINYEAVLVVGRDGHLNQAEKQRLNWRADKVLVDTKKVVCLTFDGLLSQFQTRLRALASAAGTRPEGPPPKKKPRKKKS
jgi:hypothetical protein